MAGDESDGNLAADEFRGQGIGNNPARA
jgi:hypothetical protein